MLKFYCLMAGKNGLLFSVDINKKQMVEDLQNATKDKWSNTLTGVDACELEIQLTKKGDEWRLSIIEHAALQLGEAEIPDNEKIPLTDPSALIEGVLTVAKMPDPPPGQIHLLVVIRQLQRKW
ncbi:Crinkler (CRN) [Phytophthora megakarya]|uniref:Crinkler (CRN) n=1 Tax=Phytophthora megakarya TaxID=4795 RepID=A0A225VK58_9STRA|nr:Crinkler (CRN) [Phytophthora megakarya]